MELPIPGEIESSDEVNQIFIDTLILQWQTSAATFKHNGKWWVRCSVQIWNEVCTEHISLVRRDLYYLIDIRL